MEQQTYLVFNLSPDTSGSLLGKEREGVAKELQFASKEGGEISSVKKFPLLKKERVRERFFILLMKV
ncbi:hypothetical protein [Sphingobacterium spiritivorum]|uniref:hypothetical protein n=1 Tax=Sphingobacterium spiritivorum TaxID=258 RepID=UPI00191B4F06|nr:hypothetical protein [Sphingobacterium spiritivorum]QQT26500.1 hypothetical protein I6J02_01175 [Sphingobacterium spiritivorum]